MENKVLDHQRLSELRPGEKLTIGPLEIKRAGIVWVVKNGDIKRSFEKATATLEWVNKELGRLNEGVKKNKKVQKLDVVVEQVNGKSAVLGVVEEVKAASAKKTVKLQKSMAKKQARLDKLAAHRAEKVATKAARMEKKKIKKEISIAKITAIKTARAAKKAERAARRARNKVRKFFEFLIYVFTWVLFMAFGFILFGLHTMSFIPVELAAGIESVKTLIHTLLVDETLFSAVYVGIGVLGVAVLLFAALSVQLQKTKFTKVVGIILAVLALVGTAYAVYIDFDAVVAGFQTFDRPMIAKLAFAGVNVIHLGSVLLFGWKKKAVK